MRWRKKERILREIKRYLEEKYGDNIKKVILFGSYARGEATEESDIDILVVVKDDANIKEIDNDLENLSGEYFVKEIELVNAFVIKESDYNKKRSDFLINVRREGIVI